MKWLKNLFSKRTYGNYFLINEYRMPEPQAWESGWVMEKHLNGVISLRLLYEDGTVVKIRLETRRINNES